MRKLVETRQSSTWVATADRRFVYDGWNVVEELDGTEEMNIPLRQYVWGLDLSGQNGNPTVAGIQESHSRLRKMYCYQGRLGRTIAVISPA